MITQRFGFTKDIAMEWNNSVYFRRGLLAVAG